MSLVSNWLKKGSRNSEFNGDTYLTVKLLLPGFVKRVYNINSKQLVKLFSQVRKQLLIFKVSIRAKTLMQKLNNGSILFIFNEK